MPSDVTLHAAAVWLCVGFVTGFGWALGHYAVNRLTTVFGRPARP
jgi:hypothetical protein